MKNQLKKSILTALLIVTLLFSLTLPALAAPEAELQNIVEKSAGYMLQTVQDPQVGSVGGEWAILGLARSSYAVPQAYWEQYYSTVEDYVKEHKGILHEKKYTEYSRLTVVLTAIGANPANVAGYNLLTPLGDFDKTIWQGINGPIWALLALDAGNYDMPKNPAATKQATRQMYIDEILARQLVNGGWNLSDNGGSGNADPDLTGMALQALAKYQEQSEVKTATDKALACLAQMQDADGGYASWNTSNSESTVQVMVALGELGIDLNDSRFVKNGKSLLDNVLSYRQKDGSFLHTAGGSGGNQMASEQCLYGLTSALRKAQGKTSLYRMTDVTIKVAGSGSAAVPTLPGKNADVKKLDITAPGTTFSDIVKHQNQTAIEALASRAAINGKTAASFEPDTTMTRAEFSAIIVKALGLAPQAQSKFADVKDGVWYSAYVGTANTYGIVNGVSANAFDPAGLITRQEAAAMVTRAARLCGMDTTMAAGETRDLLAQFGDYVAAEAWAKDALAFCCRENILDQGQLNIEPARAITRGEVAQMLYNLLDKAKLL